MGSKQIALSSLASLMLIVTYAAATPADEIQLAQTNDDAAQSSSSNSAQTLGSNAPSLRPAVGASSSPSIKTARAAAPAKTKGKSTASLPKKAIGFVVGSLVGLPVCIVRNPVSEEKWSIDNWTGDNKDKPRVTIPAGIAYSPFAVIDGILLSPFSSLKHSWQNFDEPFSKEQFSLGEIPKQGDAPITPTSNTDH